VVTHGFWDGLGAHWPVVTVVVLVVIGLIVLSNWLVRGGS
jgi:hypothetical protein